MAKGLGARLKDGETLIGTVLTLTSTDVAEMMALVGFDYLWIDTEHTPMDFMHAERMVQAVSGRCPCLIRIPENKEVWIKKALDLGCDGIIVPQVKSEEEARDAIEYAFYPPLGKRSVGITRAHGYGMAFREYVNEVNERLTIVLQVEHKEAVQNIRSILQVPGIGAMMIGPLDLSASLGVLGQINHPLVLDAIEEARRCCEDANVPLGIFAVDAEAAKTYIKKGLRLIALGIDSSFLWKSAKAALVEVRSGS